MGLLYDSVASYFRVVEKSLSVLSSNCNAFNCEICLAPAFTSTKKIVFSLVWFLGSFFHDPNENCTENENRAL